MKMIHSHVALVLCALFTLVFRPPALADGFDKLGAPSIAIASGTDVIVSGKGLITQPGVLSINIPAGVTIKQVLIYWEGRSGTLGDPFVGDQGPADTILVNAVPVLGARISEPGGAVPFGTFPAASGYRRDITALVTAGTIPMTVGAVNNYTLSGLDFNWANDGAAMVVIVDNGGAPKAIQAYDGVDVVVNQPGPEVGVLVAVPVTFTFAASPVARVATLFNIVGDAEEFDAMGGFRGNGLRITIGANPPMTLIDPFFSADDPRWDTLETPLIIPPGVTSVTVEPLSEDFHMPPLGTIPSSLTWIGSILQIESSLGCLGDFVWYDLNCNGIQEGGENGVPGVTVLLYTCPDEQLVGTRVTDPTGHYLFCDLVPGRYHVVFTNLPTGFVFTTKGPDGFSDGSDSDADTTTGVAECTTLDGGETDLTWDAGICCPVRITCPPDITVQCPAPTNPDATGRPTFVSPCGTATITHSDQIIQGNCPNNYVIVRTWVLVDVFGYRVTCVQRIIVVDNNPPVFVFCPPNQDLGCNPAGPIPDCNAQIRATDECGTVSVVCSSVTVTNDCLRTRTITAIATDECNNRATCQYTITWVSGDILIPHIVCGEDFEVECNTDWVFDPPSAVGNCGQVQISIVSTVTNFPAMRCPIVYSVTRTWRATDSCSTNYATCSQTATVVDIHPPNIVCEEDFEVECNTDWVFDRPTAVDKCDGTNVVITIISTVTNTAATRCPLIFSVTRTWRATDTCGNAAICSQTASIVDISPPNIVCAHDKDVECGTDWAFDIPTATDKCDGLETVTIVVSSTVTNVASPRCPKIFSVTRTWKATDLCGNNSFCNQTVTVLDTTPPNITCEKNKEVECGSDWAFDIPTAVDSCDLNNVLIEVVSTVTNVANPRCPKIMSITRTWRATDTCANSSFCNQTVTVLDTTPPNITCGDNNLVECGNPFAFTPPSAVDACDGPNVVIEITSTVTNVANPRCPALFSVTRTWRATDTCGNAAFCNQTLTVVDTTPPNITCADNLIVECGLPFGFLAPTAVDACDGTNVVITITSTVTNLANPQCPALFTVERTWRAVDTCGNATTCRQTITLFDTTPPSIFCADDRIVQCGVPWNFTPPAATDICTPAANLTITIVSTTTNAACGRTFSATRTWQVTDQCNNSSRCSQTVLVVDTRPPDLTCAPDRVLECGTPWSFTPPTAVDICDGANVTVTIESTVTNALCGATYAATRTWRATDTCGNVAHCSQTVTIVDTLPPTISCAANRVLECGTPWTFNAPNVNDVCDGPANVVVTILSTTTNALCGTTFTATRTWQAEDRCGNKSVCSQTIFLVDTVPPVLIGIPTYPLPFLCLANVPPPPVVTAFDLCDPNVTVRFSATTNGTCPSIITRCWTARDACSNEVTECQFIVVQPRPPVVLTPPTDQTVCIPDSAQFCVQVSSACPVTYQWTKDGVIIPGATAECLNLPNVTAASAGLYCVRVIGECATITNCARLTVLTNTTVVVTAPVCIPRNGSAQICPTITGTGPHTCVWSYKGNVVSTDCCLQINNYSEAQSGIYTLNVTGRCNTTTNTINLCPIIDTASIPIALVSQTTPCLHSTIVLCTTNYNNNCVQYQWYKNAPTAGNELANGTGACVTTTLDVSPTTYYLVARGGCGATNSITLGCNPKICLVKNVNRPTVGPGGLITYTYTVTNCGEIDLTNVTIVDDNGTPNTAADDFTVASGVSLTVGESRDFSFTKAAPILICDSEGMTGRIELIDLGDRIRAIFYQDPARNNNAYGTSAAAFGWTRSHTFQNLVGSDHAVFRFRNGAGTVVLEAALDYISASANFPSGFGTLGVTGGEGDVDIGNPAHVLGFGTSISENVNKPFFVANPQYRVNSPAPSDPNLAQWEVQMIYRLDISKAAFGASGFGSVIIADQHNSPENEAPLPPCEFCLTNIAVATGIGQTLTGPKTVTASDNASVCISTNPNVCIDVVKEIACLLPNNECGPFGKVATGLAGDQDVGFCYSITVTNCGETTLTNVSVIDDKLGNLTTLFFPGARTMVSGGSVTRVVKMAWGVDTTNTVVATGRAASAGARQVSATDNAVALVDRARITCISRVTAPCDLDGNPNDSHVQLPTDNTPCAVTFTVIVCNNGDVAMANVVISQAGLAGLGCTTPVIIPSLGVGACFTNSCTVTLRCNNAPIVNQVVVTGDADVGNRCSNDFDGNPITHTTTCRASVDCGGTPCFQLTKTGTLLTGQAGGTVTYTYSVTNCGGTTLTDITVRDDNGTPSIVGDDFTVGVVPSLPPGGTATLTRTVQLPITLCDDQTGQQSGQLITEVLPNGNIRATFIQDFGVNDNTYGINSIGWGSKLHKFSNLTGSDKAVFEFKNGAGQVVLEFGQDYISAITPTAQFPAGYRSLGVTGGDGGISVGNASSVLEWSTSLEENLNKQPFLGQLAQYTVDSPALSDPNSAQWEYLMIYSVVVDKNAFGASGFGSVMITDQHNSPGKRDVSGPETCGGCVTNVATGTALSGGTTLNASAFAIVCTSTNPPPPQSGGCPKTPGFWKNHTSEWVGYIPSQKVSSVFAQATGDAANKTLLQALEGKAGPTHVKDLLRHAVAGLLNASAANIAYPFSEADIIAGVNMVLLGGNKDDIEGLKDLLANANEKTKNCGSTGGSTENCDTDGKPNVLTMRYNGQSCAAAMNAQMAISGKTSCSGDPMNAASVRIVATDSSTPPGAGANVFFDGVVALNGEFEVEAANAADDRFSSNTYLYIYNGATLVQQIQIHTSCSAPLRRGDSFGALVLVDYRIDP